MHPSKFVHLLRIYMVHNINLKMDSILMQAECSHMVNLMPLNPTDNRMEHKFMANPMIHNRTVNPTEHNPTVNLMAHSNMANPMVHNSMEILLNRLIHPQLTFLHKISHLIRKSHHKCLRLCQLQYLISNHNLTQLLRLINSLNLCQLQRLINSLNLYITNSRFHLLNKS